VLGGVVIIIALLIGSARAKQLWMVCPKCGRDVVWVD
jgi:hypothetical protein